MTNPLAVYVQTNDGTENEIIAYERAADGVLAPLGRRATGGRGTGVPHLPSQSSIVLTDDGRHLLVANAGSDDVSVFEVGGRSAARSARPRRRPTRGTGAAWRRSAAPSPIPAARSAGRP